MTTTLDRPTPAPVAGPRPRRRWDRPALAALLLATAVLYLWNLDANGWGNSYYAAAVQAMSQDWTAFFFGSLDPHNVVTVDKPPASLWAMALSARLFGLSSWSILVPQVLMGVGTVWLLYAMVRRVSGPNAALLAGAVLALTPVAALMFRFDNPDALLVLLMVAAAYAVTRATEVASTRWLLLAGLLIGFAFLAKMAQAFLVLPAFVLVYAVAAPTGLGRRVWQLAGAAAAVVVGAGWWIAIAALWPASSRPYIGGSEGDSALQLALGYNGLSRLFGGSGGGPGGGGGMPRGGGDAMTGPPPGMEGGPMGGGGPGGGGFGGQAGVLRMFNDTVGGQVSWLLPAALLLLVAGLWLRGRRPRTDPVRASLLLWGGWTIVTALVFSLMEGTFHEYYTVALAPGIAALVAVGGRELWRQRALTVARVTLAVAVAGSAAWAWVLLARTPDFLPWLRWVILAAGAVGAVAMLFARGTRPGPDARDGTPDADPAGGVSGGGRHGAARPGGFAGGRWAATLALTAAVIAGLAGPTAYTVQTVANVNSGSTPHAGPRTDGGGGVSRNLFRGGEPEVSAELVALLQGAGTKWSAATTGAQTGATLQLSSDTAVISIGGFMGSDPAPTLAEFQAMVAAGEVHYFVQGGGIAGGFGPGGQGGPGGTGGGTAGVPGDGTATGGTTGGTTGGATGTTARDGRGGRGAGSEIAQWVQRSFASTTVGGQTVYDLTQPLAG